MNEWIKWEGGEECPVSPDTPIELRFRDGRIWRAEHPQFNRWSNYGVGDDIMAYRRAPSTKAKDTQVAGTHYKDMGVEPWDVVDTWPLEQRIGAYRHGALKYLMRMGSKDESAQEIAKGQHYMTKLLEVLKGE